LSVSAASLIAVTFDDREIAWLFEHQRGVLSRRQALSCGVSPDGLRHRYRPGGPWRRLLPGIYITSTGEPTTEQLQTAALLYAGQSSVITGPAALHRYRLKAPETRRVDVLVPAGHQRVSRAFVIIHRTWRVPQPETHDLALRYVSPARAVADTVLGLTKRSEVRAVVASAVQQGRCSVADLGAELAKGSVRGSKLFRSVLAEVGDGIRSPAEADFRDLIRKSGLPQPLFNPRLILDGKLLAVPDAWWADRALIVEIDSREWHLAPDDWEATMARDGRLRAVGIRVIHVTPRQVRTEPARILQDIADALREGDPVPGLVTLPTAA
jgi:very-short-patch-repair endonuclease